MVQLVTKPEDTTVERIYQRYLDGADQRERTYLGASVIGNDCSRALWYGFRWAYENIEGFSGRILRLFDTGHREEARVLDDLRGIGVTVMGQQTEFRALGGHLRGHIDGIVVGLVEAAKTKHVVEIKTHNDKSFKDLLKQGLKLSKPQHYAQLIIYMQQLKYTRGLYIAVNKNDDSIYTERVGHGGVAHEAQALLDKAARIITTSTAPPKLHEDPTAYVCGWCPARGVCHDRQFARRNCRTCISATPVTNEGDAGRWRCDLHERFLTVEEQHIGCPDHLYLPTLVPALQVDADPVKRQITYTLDNGKEWIDGQDRDYQTKTG